MKIPNKSHYYNFNSSLYFDVPDLNSWSYESSKRMSYYQRLYYEYEYTKKVGGICFYYTLTYNDKAIPNFHGKPCFCYEDIRLVTNGRLSKLLNRYYGSRLRYFCACETGEGGTDEHHVRGAGNNPHYHFLFFVQPIHDKLNRPVYDNFKLITTKDFESCLKRVWIGYDCWYPWQLAKFGSVAPGKFGAVVNSSCAFRYVSKYCLKSSEELIMIEDLKRYYYRECKSRWLDFNFWYSYYHYYRNRLIDYDKYDFFSDFKFHRYYECLKRSNLTSHQYPYNKYCNDYLDTDTKLLCLQACEWFDNVYLNQYVNDRIRFFINNYSSKPRYSKTLGEYGLNFVSSVSDNPTFSIPTLSGYQVVKPCLFYIRRLYYTVHHCDITGNVLYRLNDLGIQYKLNSLDRIIVNNTQRTLDNINYYHSDKREICKPSGCPYSDSEIKDFIYQSRDTNVMHLYSIYSVVYKYRFFDPTIQSDSFDYHSDYRSFLDTDISVFNYDDMLISIRMFDTYGYVPYFNHPVFKPYKSLFDFLDSLNIVFDSLSSDNRRQMFKDKSDFQKRFNATFFNLKLNCVYDTSSLVV